MTRTPETPVAADREGADQVVAARTLSELCQEHPAISDQRIELDPGQPGLIARLTLDPRWLATSAPAQALRRRRLRAWAHVFDAVCAEAPPPRRFAGWDSSYTGDAIAEDEMEEWLCATGGRIRALGPRRVLEIGCGTGLVAETLAPFCADYVGLDISAAAIARFRTRLSRADAGGMSISLHHGDAAILPDLRPEPFDAIVLNSVAQFFPDLAYLDATLTQVARHLRPGGSLFLGDMRHHGLLRPFRAGVEAARADAGLQIAEWRRRVDRSVAGEGELLVDPLFFHRFGGSRSWVESVDVQLKRGRHHNELSKFRYDVILRKAGPDAPARAGLRPSGTVARDLVTAAGAMTARTPDPFIITGIANARLARDLALVDLLDVGPDAGDLGSALRHLATRTDAEDPEAYWELGDRLGYRVAVRWTPGRADGAFDVLATPAAMPVAKFEPPRHRSAARALSNVPFAPDAAGWVEHDIRARCQAIGQPITFDWLSPAELRRP
jgi:SAM-dependent methyltransferase